VAVLRRESQHSRISRLAHWLSTDCVAATDTGAGTRQTQPVGVEYWLAAAGDLLLGARCHGCWRPWWGICPRCRQQIASRRPFVTTPVPCPDGFPTTVTSSAYDSILRSVINAHKERQALTLTSFLAERLASSVHVLLVNQPSRIDTRRIVLVPIPSAARTIRQRGFDATTSIARFAARRLRELYPVTVHSALSQARRVADQAGLRAAARRENLAGAFRLRRPITTGAVVLVDDLVTTGSSLTEAARVLRAAKIPLLGAATVAATVRLQSQNLSGSTDSRDPSVRGLRTQ
jgi:ComF family protein